MTVSTPAGYDLTVSSPAVFPQPSQPAPVTGVYASLPPFVRAGDLLAFDVQTSLVAGTLLFYVLTTASQTVAPVRYLIGSPGVPVGASGLAAFLVPSVVTGAWVPGRYLWVLFAVDPAGNRVELAQGEIGIDPDVNGAAPVDPRSYNERLLAALQATLAGKALDDAQMYKVGGRELTKYSVRDLLFWEGVIEARVRRERAARGEKVSPRTLGVVFGSAADPTLLQHLLAFAANDLPHILRFSPVRQWPSNAVLFLRTRLRARAD